MDKYVLDKDGNVQKCEDLIVWGKWFENADRAVKRTKIDSSEISTVFLGIDHSFGGETPILFETMIFGGKLDGEMERYATKKEAQKGHERWVAKVEEENQ